MTDGIVTKQCTQCKQTLLISEFYRRKDASCGYRRQCRGCRKAVQKTLDHSEQGKAHRKQYRQSEQGRAVQAKYRQSEKYIVYKKTHYLSEQCKAAREKRHIDNPEKRPAQAAVYYAVFTGKLSKASEHPCRECGNQARDYHHHLGYAKEHWFDVIPLCRSCHKNIHNSILN